MLKPSDKILKKLQISSSTYVENDFFTARLSGICRWNWLYSFYYFLSIIYGFFTACGFVIGAYFDKDRDQVLENIHFIPALCNMGAQAAAYHYEQKRYLELFRAIDNGFFDYKGNLDEETELEIAEIKSATKSRKQKFGFFYSTLLIVAGVGQVFKKPFFYLLTGKGTKPVDGENNLVWEAPFGMYVPYAEHWLPYVLSMFLGYSCGILVAITAIGSVVTYQYISEELLAEFKIVKKTLSKCVLSAEKMFHVRNNYTRVEKVTMDDCIIHCIKLSIEHHHNTLRMMNLFKDLMYFPLFVVIFDGGLEICISAYLIISDDVSMAVRTTMPTVIIAEVILALIFCYYGEMLTQASGDVGDSIYNSDGWLNHPRILSSYALIIKSYCNVPNELSAGGFTNVNYNTFVNILSTAYSYIGFMLST